jgi:hypothetical protein
MITPRMLRTGEGIPRRHGTGRTARGAGAVASLPAHVRARDWVQDPWRAGRRSSLLTAVLVAATLSISGCGALSSPTETRSGAQFVGEDAYQARYRAVVKSFPEKVPPGASFPATAPPLEPGAETQLSGGDAQAYLEWQCMWEKVYLDPADPAQKAEAMEQLRRFPHTAWARHWYEDPGNIWGKTLDAAELGDTSTLAEFSRHGCS